MCVDDYGPPDDMREHENVQLCEVRAVPLCSPHDIIPFFLSMDHVTASVNEFVVHFCLVVF